MESETSKKKVRGLKMRAVGRLAAVLLLGVTAFTAVLMYLHSAYGWFSNNREVTADDMAVRLNDLFFDIAVPNVGQRPVSLIDAESPWVDESEGIRVVDILRPALEYLEEASNGGHEILPITDNSHTALFCEFNNEYFSENDDIGISPGSYGSISFDIVLKDENPADFIIDFDYLPLETVRTIDPETSAERLSARIPSNYDELRQLLSGHILLFKSRTSHTGGSSGYYYSDLIDGQMRVSAVTDSSDPGYNCTVDSDGRYHCEVTVYWTWPLTFTHMAYLLEGHSDILHTQPMFNVQSELNVMLAAIRANPERFFRFPSDSPLLDGEGHISPLSVGFQNDPGAYLTFCTGYNRADQIIGSNARYLALIACVNEAESVSAPEP